MNALVDVPDDGGVIAISRKYRSTLDRMKALDDKWMGMEDDQTCYIGNGNEPSSKFDVAAAAHTLLMENERLFLAVFHRRPETVGDIAVVAAHGFVLLDREVWDNPRAASDDLIITARRALADIATTGARLGGVGFDMIGPQGLPARLRACLGR